MQSRLDTAIQARPAWGAWAWGFIAGLLVVRIVYLTIFPADLVHDEAYYWEWSRRLDWGYYSKPPLVAWLIRLSTEALGTSAMSVRLPAVLLGTAGLGFVLLLARDMYGPRAGWWALLLAALSPGNVAGSLIMTIDAPLLFCWGAALLGFWRWLAQPNKHSGGGWLALATLAVGMGLLAKQTMLAFPVGTFFFLVSGREHRWRLRHWPYWGFVGASLAFLTPVLWWNARHAWITVQHTSGHFTAESVAWSRRLVRGLEFHAAQGGVAGPVTAVLALICALACLRAFSRLHGRERLLSWLGAIPWMTVGGLSFLQRVEPNWPAPFLATTIVLTAGIMAGPFSVEGVGRPVSEKWLRRAAFVGVLFTLLTYGIPFLVVMTGWKGSRLDPLVRLWGWRELAQALEEQTGGAIARADAVVFVTTGRALASELAFYLADHPRVHPWDSSGKISSQYCVWGPPPVGGPAFVVTAPGERVPGDLEQRLGGVAAVGRVWVSIGNGRGHDYELWRGGEGLAAFVAKSGDGPPAIRGDGGNGVR